jgi:hypothetical protein
MSRIQWEKARAVILSLYQPNREWPNLSYLAQCPTEWPQHFTPVHLAHLQAPPIGKDRSHTKAWRAAIESAAGAGELPNVLQSFILLRGVMVAGPADKFGQRHLMWEAKSYTKNLPSIAADDFHAWLLSQGATASEHIAAWFDAWRTPPAQTAPVVTAPTAPMETITETASMADGAPEQSLQPAPPDAPAPKPLQRQRAQDAAVLLQIKALGHDPQRLPKNQPGKRGVKADVRAALHNNPLLKDGTKFSKCWERLTEFNDLKYEK